MKNPASPHDSNRSTPHEKPALAPAAPPVSSAPIHAAASGAYRETGEQFRLLIENGTDVISILESDATIRYQSPSVQRVLGFSPAELQGRNALEFVHPDDVLHVQQRIRSGVAQPGVSFPVTYRFRHKDGSWRHLESVGNNLLHDPQIAGVVINSRDISERVAYEQQIFEQHTKLAESNRRLEATNAQLQTANARLAMLAETDNLTGLKNQRAFAWRIEQEVQRATRYGTALSLIIADIDKFKTLNDSFGHLAGDRVLEIVADVLQKQVRKIDFVARYGGEEFVIIMPSTGPIGAIALAESLRASFEKTQWPERAVTLSFGVASLLPDQVEGEALFTEADRALYHAKSHGRNCVVHSASLRPDEKQSAHVPPRESSARHDSSTRIAAGDSAA